MLPSYVAVKKHGIQSLYIANILRRNVLEKHKFTKRVISVVQTLTELLMQELMQQKDNIDVIIPPVGEG